MVGPAWPLNASAPPTDLAGEIGVTTGSFSRQLAKDPERWQLPKLLDVVHDDLQVRVVDVYTPTLASMEPDYLDQVREHAERLGCVLTNLKLNQKGLSLGSADAELRDRSLREYKRSIDAAARLGMRWVRPLPAANAPDRGSLAADYRELIAYGAERNIQVLVENYGWMQTDPRSVVTLLEAVGSHAAASPDTGNWANNDVRYAGLALTFPKAVTCDFKAKAFDAGGRHAEYDLKRCFTIGWDAGFRGPWCIEHSHPEVSVLLDELKRLRDRLRQWMAEQA
jgi:hypothetical protein